MGCCYQVQWLTDGTDDGFFLTPDVNYDDWHGTYGFEYLDEQGCLDQIQQHFEQIKLMGFNAIRFYGSGPYYTDIKDIGTTFRIDASSTISGEKYHYQLINPYIDIVSQKVFSMIDAVLYRAYLEDLKVILDTELWVNKLVMIFFPTNSR